MSAAGAPGAAGFLPAKWVSAGVSALVVLFLLLKIGPVATPAKWDECLYVYDAHRVLEGQVAYRDFFNFTPPGIFYTLAAWSLPWAADRPLTAGRYYALAGALLAAWLIFRTLRRAGWGRGLATAAAALFPVAIFAFWPVPSHHWLGLLPWLASLEAYDFGAGRVRGPWGWAWIGATGALAFLSLQTCFLELATLWGALWLLRDVRKGRSFASCALGFAVVAGPALVAIALAGALPAMVRDVVLWTGGSYAAEGGPNAVRLLEDLPLRLGGLWERPTLSVFLWVPWAVAGTLAYLGLAALGLGFLGLMGRELWSALRERKLGGGLLAPAAVLTAADLALFLRGKTDWLHLTYALVPVGVAWAVALPPPDLGGKASRALKWCLGLLLGASVLFHLGYLTSHRPSAWEFTDVDRPTREAPVNAWLRARPWLGAEDTIAAFPEGGQVYLYVREAAVGHTLFLPLSDHLHTAGEHAEVAGELRARAPRCVVLTADREGDYLDPASPVAAVLRGDYERLAVVGDAVVYLRRRGP